MHTNEPRELQGVELGYDPRDIDSKNIYKIVFWFFVVTVVVYGAGALLFRAFGWGGRTSFDPRKPAIAGPRVQGNITAKVDIMEMRQTERRLMETYEERPNGTWRIPVDRAMQIVATDGLPAVTSDQPAVSEGNTIPQNATGPGTTDANAAPRPSDVEPTPSDIPTSDPGMSAPTPATP